MDKRRHVGLTPVDLGENVLAQRNTEILPDVRSIRETLTDEHIIRSGRSAPSAQLLQLPSKGRPPSGAKIPSDVSKADCLWTTHAYFPLDITIIYSHPKALYDRLVKITLSPDRPADSLHVFSRATVTLS